MSRPIVSPSGMDLQSWRGKGISGQVSTSLGGLKTGFSLQANYIACPCGRMEVFVLGFQPLQTSQALLPIDPYLYGYWLGNGCATRPEITVRTGDVEHVTEQIPYEISNSWLNVGDSRVLRIPALKEILLKSHRDKQIEPSYLRVSKSQRI